MYMHSFQGGATLLSLGLIFILYTMFVWWRDVLRESTLEGHHTKIVQLGPRYGFILFIVSEVMFFFAFFWASFHSSLAPTVEIGGIWPPKGIGVLDPWEIPFLNTRFLFLFLHRFFGVSLPVGVLLVLWGDWDWSNMMAPSGAAGPSSSNPLPFDLNLPDAAGPSSSNPLPFDLNLPDAAEIDPNPGEPAGPGAEVYHPLLEEEKRRKVLKKRLSTNTIWSPLPEDTLDLIVEIQLQTELKVEKALRSAGVSDDSLVAKLNPIRGFMFYPHGEPLAERTYRRHLTSMEKWGTVGSLPYKRVRDAIKKNNLSLEGGEI
ncbi:Cytochrome c oxidase subunit 3 [Linum grandiflorum]